MPKPVRYFFIPYLFPHQQEASSMVAQLRNTTDGALGTTKIEKPYLRGIVHQLDCICGQLERIEKCLKQGDDIYPKLQAALADSKSWIVCGRVVDSQNNGVSGLSIYLFDRDWPTGDDRLGATRTNEDGAFCLVYQASDFQDCFGKCEGQYPDLYLIAKQQEGNTLFLIETPVRWAAGNCERFYLVINDNGTVTVE